MIINEINIVHHLKKFGSKVKVLFLKLKQRIVDIFSSRIDKSQKYGTVRLTTGDITKISQIFTKELSLSEAFDPNEPENKFRLNLGFLFEYAITVYAAQIAGVPVLKRLGANKFEAAQPLKESLSNDTMGAKAAHDVAKKMSTSEIASSTSNMMAYYMSKRKELLDLHGIIKNDLNKKAFEELFGLGESDEKATPKMTEIVNDILSAFKKEDVKLVAIIHAGEYTSAMVKADISFLYMSKNVEGSEGEETPALHNVSLKLYSEHMDYITGLKARPYAFWYLANNDFNAKQYNEQGVDKSAREEFLDLFPKFKSAINKRETATEDETKLMNNISKNVLDYFIFKLQEDRGATVTNFVSLFQTILKGVESSEFRSYAKSKEHGIYRREASIEGIKAENVVVMRIKKHGDGYKINFDFERDKKYFYDTSIMFSPREGKIAVEYRQSVYIKEEGSV